MRTTANIVEIFSSLQGEGVHVGTPMTFVRFGLCSMGCRYCDTPSGVCHEGECRVERPPRSQSFEALANPVSVTALCAILEGFDDETVSVTGGEPMEQAGFLAQLMPALSPRRRIMLETNGVHVRGLEELLPHISVVSMDMKLPSSTGRPPRWEEHEAFLRAVVGAGREVYVKLVVTEDTSDSDIQRSIGIITGINRFIPIVIQPAGSTMTFASAIAEDRLMSLKRLCGAYLEDVRVVPQMHKQWGVL